MRESGGARAVGRSGGGESSWVTAVTVMKPQAVSDCEMKIDQEVRGGQRAAGVGQRDSIGSMAMVVEADRRACEAKQKGKKGEIGSRKRDTRRGGSGDNEKTAVADEAERRCENSGTRRRRREIVGDGGDGVRQRDSINREHGISRKEWEWHGGSRYEGGK
jgi:hypothetical protein